MVDLYENFQLPFDVQEVNLPIHRMSCQHSVFKSVSKLLLYSILGEGDSRNLVLTMVFAYVEPSLLWATMIDPRLVSWHIDLGLWHYDGMYQIIHIET